VTIRKRDDHYGNFLYYTRGICRSCEKRCPAEGAFSEEGGHDKIYCWQYGRGPVKKEMTAKLKQYLKPRADIVQGEERKIYNVGCAFNQFDVPCIGRNPTAL